MRLAPLCLIIILLLTLLLTPTAPADELDIFLESQARLLEDDSKPLDQRASIALEMASALDRAAGRASSVEERRARWREAASILDRFAKSHPHRPESRPLSVQAAVFEWAIGASWLRESLLAPTDRDLRDHAQRRLDAAIDRLQTLLAASEDSSSPLALQIRLRLAQALLDRSKLVPPGSKSASESLAQALDILGSAAEMNDLAPLAHLQKARILLALERPADALKELDALSDAKSSAPKVDLSRLRVESLIALHQFDAAEKILRQQPPDSPESHLLRLELALERRAVATSDALRGVAESDAFAQTRSLQSVGGDDAISSLLRLAEAIDQPSETAAPADLDLLAQGRLRLGRPEEASRLELQAARAAESKDDAFQAAQFRLKAAGILLRARRRVQAQHLLDQVSESESAGPLRPKAALLRALSMQDSSGRPLPETEQNAYEQTLKSLIERFPGAPEAQEARWFLGRAFRLDGNLDGAADRWKEIPQDHPRWLDAQLALAALRADRIETDLAEGERRQALDRLGLARQALENLAQAVSTDLAEADVVLAQARLETLPEAGDPQRASDNLERLLRQPLDPARRRQAQRLQVLALIELGRSIQAMKTARSLLETARPSDLLTLARRLDQAAASAPSDLLRRRFGEVLRLVATHLVEHPEDLSADEQAEARLRQLRGLLFHGDARAARQGLESWADAETSLPADDQLDLVSLALDAGVPDRALAVSRALASRHKPDSPAWFRARLAQAQALHALDQTADALRLLDATATLHPDFGGESLRQRYLSLRERLERDQSRRPDR